MSRMLTSGAKSSCDKMVSIAMEFGWGEGESEALLTDSKTKYFVDFVQVSICVELK